MAINSDDELFHEYLYDWHVARRLHEQLLEVNNQSFVIENSLTRLSSIPHSLSDIYRPQAVTSKIVEICYGSIMLEEKNTYLLRKRSSISLHGRGMSMFERYRLMSVR